MLSARELNPAALPNRTWVNERLTFTHGHGLTLGPVNQVTGEGLPVLFIRDLPPISTVNIPVTEPSLYFGELSNEYAIVRTRAREFHYPKGDDNVFSTYEGTGGIALDSLWKKLAFAARFRDYQLLLSDDITAESRLIFDRQIARRAQKIAPFLTFDDDPYLVVHDGRLFWILDAYTVTDRYPYASEAVARHQLHPQRRQGGDRRLPRHDDVLPGRAGRPHRARLRQGVSRRCSRRSTRCPPGCAGTSATPRASSGCRRPSTRPTT